MKRYPVKDRGETPPCFGQSPSVMDRGCAGCAARKRCVRAFSKPLSVRVLARPRRSNTVAAEQPRDKLISAINSYGLDDRMWLSLCTVLRSGGGLRPKFPKRVVGYKVLFKDSSSRRVVGLKRLDRRSVTLHLWRVDPVAAAEAGGVLRGRHFVFSCDGEGFGSLLSGLSSVMRASVVTGTFKVAHGV